MGEGAGGTCAEKPLHPAPTRQGRSVKTRLHPMVWMWSKDIVKRHIDWLRRLRIPSFIFISAGYIFIFKIVLGIFYIAFYILFTGTENGDVLDSGDKIGYGLFIKMVVLAPLIETFLGQWLPIRLTEFVTKRTSVLMIISISVFTALHELSDLVIGLSGGLVFAFSFIHWKRVSFWRAYWVTAAAHGVHNASMFFVKLLKSVI